MGAISDPIKMPRPLEFAAPPRFSVVVPLYNEERRLPGLVQALKAQTFHDFEVIFVDNNSQDGTHRWLLEHVGGWAHVVQERSLQNADAARNAGVQVARGNAFAFTDADCLPDPRWLAEGAAAFAATGADLIAGRIAFDLGATPGPAELYDSVTFLQHSASVAERGVAFTANLFVARRVFDEIGLFDVTTAWNGDVLFTRRAVNSGYALAYADRAVIRHPARSVADVLKKAWRIARGKGRYRQQSLNKPTGRPLGGAEVFLEPKPHFRHLHPKLLKQSLMRNGHSPATRTLALSWLVACLVAGTGALGFCTGRLTAATDPQLPHS